MNNKKQNKDNSSNHQANKYQRGTLTPRQFTVYNAIALGQQVKEIAKKLNVCETSVYRDINAIKETNWHKEQEERLKKLDGMALSNFMANLKLGNFDAAKTYYKGLGILQDNVKVRVAVDVDPGATQREIEAGEGRLEDLLKKKGAVEAEFSVVEDAPQEGVKEGQDTHDHPQKDT